MKLNWKTGVVLGGVALIGGAWYLDERKRNIKKGEKKLPPLREELESEYEQGGATVTIYRRVHQTQGTIGYRVTVSGPDFFEEGHTDTLSEAMEFANQILEV